MTLPQWASARLAFDRLCRPEFESDPYFEDVLDIFHQTLPQNSATVLEISTTASSVEVLFERRSKETIVLWDVDFTSRVDGLLALIFCDASDDESNYQGMGIAAYSDLAASRFIGKDPAVAQYILKLTDDFLPDSFSVTVEEDVRMDRYRRLIRAYVAFHELAHIIYRVLPEERFKIDQQMQNTIASIEPSQLVLHRSDLSPVDLELEEKGLLVRPLDVNDVLDQIAEHLTRPNDYEEIWCDVFASQQLLSWADDNGFSPHECIVVDDLLHLILAGRIQWDCFWDRSNELARWDQADLLSNHENRTNIRGLLMANNGLRIWRQSNLEGSDEDAGTKFAKLVSTDGDELKKRFVDRHHLSLGILGGLDRMEMFDLADQNWAQFAADQQHAIIEEMLTNLS